MDIGWARTGNITEGSRQRSGSTNEKNQIWKSVIETLTDPVADMDKEEHEKYLNKIISKLKRGKKLSNSELNYLSVHEPRLYMTALRVRQQKEALKQRLKNCHSKQEAQEVIDSATGSVGKKDPDREYIIAGLREIEKEFKNSKFYCRLPDKEDVKETERRKLLKHFSGKIFEEDAGGDMQEDIFAGNNVTPMAELLDELPVFEAKA